MGGIKRLLEEEAARQGSDNISQPSVFQAAQRRLDVERRKYFLERLCFLSVKDSWADKPVASILMSMTDEEIKNTFEPVLHELLQEGREINHFYLVPEPVLTSKKVMDLAVEKSGTTCHKCGYENDGAIDLETLERIMDALDSCPSKQEMWERHQEMLREERKLAQLEEGCEGDTGDDVGIQLSGNKD